MNPITIFRGTSGLNTVADPARIPLGENGISGLAEAVNISIDQYYRPSRRKGFDLLQSGGYHSLYCNGGDCFVAKDGAIYQVASDYSLTGIRSGMVESARISWEQYGDKTYYANGYERGVILDGISYVWETGDYHGPTTNKTFTIPPGLNHLGIHSGRMFAAENNVLWWSEPFRFDLFDMKSSFIQFHTKIRMIKAVIGGIFVSTENQIWFISGDLPQEFRARRVSTFPGIEWSDAIEYVDGSDLGLNVSGPCAVWASTEGAILGTPDGQIINLNKEKLIYPEDVTRGFGCMVGYMYIHGMR